MDYRDGLQAQDFGIGQLFWRIHEAVIVGDADTDEIVLWNPAAEVLFGYAEAEAIGRPIEILIPEHLRGPHRAGLAHFAATGQSVLMDADLGLELPAVHKSGRLLTIELLLSPIDDAPTDGRFVLAVIRDATACKHAEEQRIELARDQSARVVAEAAQERFAMLAEASRLLASSLDWETTLGNGARLVVPQFMVTSRPRIGREAGRTSSSPSRRAAGQMASGHHQNQSPWRRKAIETLRSEPRHAAARHPLARDTRWQPPTPSAVWVSTHAERRSGAFTLLWASLRYR